MHSTVRKHPRTEVRNGHVRNGHGMPTLTLPASMRELGFNQEPLHLREALYDVLGGFLGNQATPFTRNWNQRLSTQWGTEFQEGMWVPPMNVRETGSEVILKAFIPGVRKDDIEVEIKNGSILILKGEIKSADKEDEEMGYLRKEMRCHCFYRSFALPLEVRPDGIEASYENGVLEICLKKKEEAKANTYKVSIR